MRRYYQGSRNVLRSVMCQGCHRPHKTSEQMQDTWVKTRREAPTPARLSPATRPPRRRTGCKDWRLETAGVWAVGGETLRAGCRQASETRIAVRANWGRSFIHHDHVCLLASVIHTVAGVESGFDHDRNGRHGTGQSGGRRLARLRAAVTKVSRHYLTSSCQRPRTSTQVCSGYGRVRVRVRR